MSPLESALTTWIAFHSQLGVDMEAYLLPPATEAQITQVEEKIGFRLPEDLRELYKIANGQWNMFDDDAALIDANMDKRWAPLFGNHDFMPLHKALRQYEVYLDIYTTDLEFNTKYNQANPDQLIEPTIWEVREGDAVDSAGWNPNWFTFAGSEANSYSVDMTPPHGGAPGQVVLHGADEYILQVVGDSVTDLMEQAVIHLNADEPHRFQYADKDGPYSSNVFFDMDWRAQHHIVQEQAEVPAAYVAWMQEKQQAQDTLHMQLDAWLSARGMAAQQRASFTQWVEIRLSLGHMNVPPMSVLLELQAQSISQGEMPDFSELANAVPSESNGLQAYAMSLAAAYLSSDAMMAGFGLSMSVHEAIDLFHEFKRESGDWSQTDFEKVNEFFSELRELPLNRENGYGMDLVDGRLSICQSTFDEESFKSNESCYEINLKRFDG